MRTAVSTRSLENKTDVLSEESKNYRMILDKELAAAYETEGLTACLMLKIGHSLADNVSAGPRKNQEFFQKNIVILPAHGTRVPQLWGRLPRRSHDLR